MKVFDEFGANVFSNAVMRERLPSEAYKEVQRVAEHGGQISMQTADVVAKAMMEWAIEKGATHYTHWFQPLTGVTAEKHDSFLTAPDKMGKAILNLTGKQLIMGEPDASSFPSGGLRATHYARGYTAWDMTSPAFVKEMACGTILCIPTVFVSYNGEALDNKTPLLRSMEALSKQAVRILRLFGDQKSEQVLISVGAEQEYFIVDRERYLKRRDLIYTGRTLFGAPAPKGQELEDQYFGVIRERVGEFMADLNRELWKMGITATTQHNEVAPAQHESAPIYSTCNVAVDQNQLTMETMKRVATRHGLVCLLHEKPFAGVNGSGKHNNWSLSSDTGENLLDPGTTPNDNLQFLLVLSCIIKAVDRHADLLRMSTACPGNDQRLGADEAPPAIISIFLGAQLSDVVDQIVEKGTAEGCIAGGRLDTGVSTLPVIDKDATDRNRTSPFAFTGNKFEFRMVGSSESIANSNTVISTIVAEAFCEAADALEKSENFERDVNLLIAENMRNHRRVLFNGNGYSEEWKQEAARRGLPNLPNMVAAIPALTTEKTVKMYEKFGVFTEAELESRSEVLYETYAKTTAIEARTMLKIANKQLIPAASAYMGELASSAAAKAAAVEGISTKAESKVLVALSKYTDEMSDAADDLKAVTDKVSDMDNEAAKAHAFHDEVIPAMDRLRAAADQAEELVDEDFWPLPCYSRMLFYTE